MSGDEIDAELLAMAGDSSDSESEGEVAEDASAPEQDEPAVVDSARSPSQEAKPSVEKPVEEPPPSARRGVAQKVRKRGRKKVTRQEIEDELDDLGDGSASPPASLGSGAMSQSDSEADAPASSDMEDGPLYPVEGQFMSASDRAHILSLPEIEREEILAERAQEVLKRQQDLTLKKALADASARASKTKRKAAAADLDDSLRKSSRPKTEKTGRTALDDYKKARQAKGERTSRLDTRHDGKRSSRSPSAASDRDADGESEVEWAEPTASTRRDELPADLKDFDRCRIGRSTFARLLFYPNFETTVKGCFCRVSIGVNRETGMNLYRMTQIKGFVAGKPYQLESGNGKTFTCDQYALVAHGNAEKPWPFSACSDSALTPAEYDRFLDTLHKEHLRVPKKAWLHQKLDDLLAFNHIKWTDEVLQGKFARQREMEKRVNPANQINIKREAILKRKTEAEEIEDAEEIARCEAELAALENQHVTHGSATTTNGLAAKLKVSPLKPVGHTPTQQERLAALNAKNRGKNSEDVRRALLEERRKMQEGRRRAFAEAQAKAQALAEQKRVAEEEEKRKADEGLLGVPTNKDIADLFGDTPDISRAGTPMSGGVSTPLLRARRSRAGTPLNGVKKDASGLGRKKQADEDFLAEMDLGIDVEI